ncbi:MAG: hypothetical protein ACK4MV_02875 [Beijerinckiaceae bacterium]
MKEITIPVLWAATEYYFGSLLWIGIAAGILGLVLWVAALRKKDNGGVGRAFRASLIVGLLAGIGFAASLPSLTRSSWPYVSGLTDYVVILGAGLALAAAITYLLTPFVMLMKSPYPVE